jgi:hypothetical protein
MRDLSILSTSMLASVAFGVGYLLRHLIPEPT